MFLRATSRRVGAARRLPAKRAPVFPAMPCRLKPFRDEFVELGSDSSPPRWPRLSPVPLSVPSWRRRPESGGSAVLPRGVADRVIE